MTFQKFFGAFFTVAIVMTIGFVLCVIGKNFTQFVGVALLAVSPGLAIGADLATPSPKE